MKIYNLKATPVASVRGLKDEQKPKAKQIVLGADAHLRGYQVGRKIDHAVVGVVESLRLIAASSKGSGARTTESMPAT